MLIIWTNLSAFPKTSERFVKRHTQWLIQSSPTSDSRKRQDDLAPKCLPCQFPRLVGPTNNNTNIWHGRAIARPTDDRGKAENYFPRERASFLREAAAASYGARINLGRPNDPAAVNPPTDKSRCGNWLSDGNSPWRLHPRSRVHLYLYARGNLVVRCS